MLTEVKHALGTKDRKEEDSGYDELFQIAPTDFSVVLLNMYVLLNA